MRLRYPADIVAVQHLEGCESGRIGTLGKRVTFTGPWVRIPPSPLKNGPPSFDRSTSNESEPRIHSTERMPVIVCDVRHVADTDHQRGVERFSWIDRMAVSLGEFVGPA